MHQHSDNKQNGPKMDPKWTQNGPKMDPKWTQNGPKMDTIWTPNWTPYGPQMDTTRTQHWHNIPQMDPNGPQMDPKWTPIGPQMDPKWTLNGHKMDTKWTQNGHKMDTKWTTKWTQNGPKMDPKWTQNGPKMDPHGDTHISAPGAWHTYKRGSPRYGYSFSVIPWMVVMCCWFCDEIQPISSLQCWWSGPCCWRSKSSVPKGLLQSEDFFVEVLLRLAHLTCKSIFGVKCKVSWCVFFNPNRPKWCTSSDRLCVALGFDRWHCCSFDVNSGHGCTNSPLHTVLEFRNEFLVGHSLFYNTNPCCDVVDTTMHRTVFLVEQLISLCCRVGTSSRLIISIVR